ncbi:AAA family ATPase [Sphingobacterium hotanense]|uniref:AAA family ATPase n=2 Tax=Sphingobacterium hotanense TaxID=649196 RepID=A0ABT7NSE1_9SPHI|nr:AAA family ATPase [Sphingobacterium hotanense]
MRNSKHLVDNRLIKFHDAECYFEDTRKNNDFDGEWGQRLLVDQWNGVHPSGKHIYGIGYETSMVNTTIIKLNDNRFYDKVIRILEGDQFYLIEEEMKNLKALLDLKKQVIFQGPPGTGKTYTAKNLAEFLLTENVTTNKKEQSEILKLNKQFEIIQFHPAYTYEDFIRGIVTEPHGDKIQYVAKDKLFLELVDKAINDPENKPYVLIIDEINRANLSAVLGELIYALEYRDESFKSMYANQSGNYDITIPSNLYIIGTMNTADKSVGHMDYALRRRFAFYDVLPKVCDESNFEKDLFIKVSTLFVKEIKANVDELEASDYLSMEFKDRPQDIWLGHSYFFRKEGSDFSLRIQYEILPILQEYVKDGILNNTDEVKNILKEISNYKIEDANS